MLPPDIDLFPAPSLPSAVVPSVYEETNPIGIMPDFPQAPSFQPATPNLVPLSELLGYMPCQPLFYPINFTLPQPILFREDHRSPDDLLKWSSFPIDNMPSSPSETRALKKQRGRPKMKSSTIFPVRPDRRKTRGRPSKRIGNAAALNNTFRAAPPHIPPPVKPLKPQLQPQLQPSSAPTAAVDSSVSPMSRSTRGDKSTLASADKPRRIGVSRSNPGCWTCKVRRKLCDRGKPSCAACEHLGLVCDGYSPTKPIYMIDTKANQKRREELAEIVRKSRESLGVPLPFFRKKVG